MSFEIWTVETNRKRARLTLLMSNKILSCLSLLRSLRCARIFARATGISPVRFRVFDIFGNSQFAQTHLHRRLREAHAIHIAVCQSHSRVFVCVCVVVAATAIVCCVNDWMGNKRQNRISNDGIMPLFSQPNKWMEWVARNASNFNLCVSFFRFISCLVSSIHILSAERRDMCQQTYGVRTLLHSGVFLFLHSRNEW